MRHQLKGIGDEAYQWQEHRKSKLLKDASIQLTIGADFRQDFRIPGPTDDIHLYKNWGQERSQKIAEGRLLQ